MATVSTPFDFLNIGLVSTASRKHSKNQLPSTGKQQQYYGKDGMDPPLDGSNASNNCSDNWNESQHWREHH
jgi:hypothetical protein